MVSAVNASVAPRCFSNPTSSENEARGSQDTTSQSIMMCDVDILKDLYGNMVLSGGATVFTDVCERMSKDPTTLTPSTMMSKVAEPPPSRVLCGHRRLQYLVFERVPAQADLIVGV